MDENNLIKKKNRSTFYDFILWWRIDQEELTKQVQEYKSLGIWRSARKVSALLLIFSSIVTVLFVIFLNWDSFSLIDVAVSLLLALFIYRGYRWALIVAMFYWTFEKIFTIYEGFSSGSFSQTTPIFVLFIWWAAYMHTFYLAFKVESSRTKGAKTYSS